MGAGGGDWRWGIENMNGRGGSVEKELRKDLEYECDGVNRVRGEGIMRGFEI